MAGARDADVGPVRAVVARDEPRTHRAPAGGRVRLVAAGAFLGLAWGLSLRAWMTLLVLGFGGWPEYTYRGSFGAVIVPATVLGAVLGWAEAQRRSPLPSRGWRWTALAPLLMAVPAALLTPGFVDTVLDDGRGLGAVGVTLIGLGGGFAVSGRGRTWGRWLAGAGAAGVTAATLWFVYVDQPDPLAPSNVVGALLFLVLMTAFVVGSAIPHRRPQPPATSPETPGG